MEKDTRVVISGISGLFPNDYNLEQFKTSIFANECLVGKSKRYDVEKIGSETFIGEISYKRFDYSFHGITRLSAYWIDPAQRLAFERGFEAIMDAGVNPDSLSTTRTSVHYATTFSDFTSRSVYMMSWINSNYVIMGNNAGMGGNRFSFAYNLTGHSSAIESSGTSFQQALHNAVTDITSGACEMAVVLGGSVARSSQTTQQLKSLGMLSPDQYTRSFDENGHGAPRSDGSVALFLQRADAAKRCYATVLDSSAGMVPGQARGQLLIPSPDGMEGFLRAAYQRAGRDPADLAYLEADGMGVPLRDEMELLAHERALLGQHKQGPPLRVGSVRSNVGNMYNLSGGVALCKAVVAMETGVIPATINCTKPNSRVPALRDGRMQIVTENTPLEITEKTIVGVTTIGVGGDVGHAILQPHLKKKKPANESIQLPRLLILSGRSEEALERTLHKFQEYPFDVEFIRLLQDVYSSPVRGYEYRTMTIAPALPNDTVIVQRPTKRALWFVFSGMGSQWIGMGADLMHLPIYRDTIERLHDVLLPKGLDLKRILTGTDESIFDDIANSSVAITASQIALTNVLKAVGLVPDGIIGHSLGELGCAYADGCLTEAQTVLATWARGQAAYLSVKMKGLMAAVGVGYHDIKSRLPPSIDVACRNSSTSCTLSGPAEDVQAFVSQLQSEGVFARTVNSSNIAFHSRYVQPAAPLLRRLMEEIIPESCPRSSKWISTSVPQSGWDTPAGRFSSSEYFTNNLLSPVLFEEGLRHVPGSALLVEVAPHGLLQAILKRALPNAQHEPLTRRGAPSQLRTMLTAIGRTAFAGLNPVVSALYPDVSFPVSRGTPSISPLVEWVYEENKTCDDKLNDRRVAIQETIELNSDSPFMKVHGTSYFPLSHMLILAWKCLASTRQEPMDTFGVVFEDVYVGSYAQLPSEGSMNINVSMMNGSGDFELSLVSTSNSKSEEAGRRVAWGRIRVKDIDEKPISSSLPVPDVSEVEEVTAEEALNELKVRGIQYSNNLSALSAIRCSAKDWIVELQADGGLDCVVEGLLQSAVLSVVGNAESLVLPNYIQRLEMDPVELFGSKEGLVAQYHLSSVIMKGPGLFLTGLKTADYRNVTVAPKTETSNGAVCRLQFPFYGKSEFKSAEELASLAVQLASERSPSRVQLLELPGGKQWGRLLDSVSIQMERLECAPRLPGCSVLAACGPGELAEAARALAQQGGLGLVLASGPTPAAEAKALELRELARCPQGALLCRLRPLSPSVKVVLLDASQPPPASLPHPEAVLVWRGISPRAAAAAVSAARRHGYANRARLVFILDNGAPVFSMSDPLYANQLQLGLFINTLHNGQWGSWKHLPVLDNADKKPALCSSAGARIEAISFPCVVSDMADRKLARCRPVNLVMQGDMLLGWLLPDSSLPQADSELRWPVPSGWSTDSAVSAPWAYAMAYLTLQERARARRGESVLILDAASGVGQAAVRVAAQIGCDPILATVTSQSECSFVEGLCAKVQCAVLPGEPQALSGWVRRCTRGRGADVVLGAPSGRSLHLVLGVLAESGRIVHTAPQVSCTAATMGMLVFNFNSCFYGVTGEQLLRGSQHLRQAVANAVREGLEKGHVQPIAAPSRISDESRIHSSPSDDSRDSKDLLNESCSPHKLYIIAGGDGHEWPAVAEMLWRRGARHVLSAGGGTASRYRLRALRRLGLQVRHGQPRAGPEDPEDPEDLLRSATPPAAAVVLILKDGESPDVAAAPWQRCFSPDTLPPLLLLRRSQLLQLPALLRAARPGVTLLPAPPAASPATGVAGCCELPVSCWLPRSLSALSSLGSRYTSRGRGDAVRVRGVPGALSRLNHCGEAPPLLALPPLGALHSADASEAVSALAGRLVCPLLCVESRPRTDMREHAADIKQAVLRLLRLQWAGPLGVLGWGPSVPLALELTRQLEAAGRTVVAFLLCGDQLSLGAAALSPLDIVMEATAEDFSAQEALQQLPADSAWSSLVAAVRELPGVARDVTAGLEGVRDTLQAIRDHRPQEEAGPRRSRLHFLTVSNPAGLKCEGSRVVLHRLLRVEVAAGLRSARLAQVINEHSALPRLASDQEVREQLQLESARNRARPLAL